MDETELIFIEDDERNARSVRTDHRTTDAARLAQVITSPEQAYDVQQGVAERLAWFKPGAPAHWKTGGPSRRDVQTHARLPEHGIWRSPAKSSWPFGRRYRPR